MNFPDIALHVPTILLPRAGIDLSRWAVVACDQYTSQPEYWEQVERLVGDSPSTLRLILPEAHLGLPGRHARIEAIDHAMQQYVAEGVLTACEPGFILVDRTDSAGRTRRGLVVALDLEAYDYHPGATTLIRTSEGTVVDRLPPRAAIRQGAAIETPHVMVLIDDPERSVVEPLSDEKLPVAYDFELMQGGGHIRGYHVAQERLWRKVAINLARLGAPELFASRYDVSDRPALLYAMGDGNHSFAAAKVVWEQVKERATDTRAVMTHPARYALVELINVHDQGLVFGPIHRVVVGVEPLELLRRMQAFYQTAGCVCSYHAFAGLADIRREQDRPHSRAVHLIPYVNSDAYGLLRIETPRSALAAGSLQSYFDASAQRGAPLAVDYIHGDEALVRLARRPDALGFLLPTLSKHDLFRTVVLDGTLPRKTFSMGEADDKRYYLECRKIA
jgi:hypothetical protein